MSIIKVNTESGNPYHETDDGKFSSPDGGGNGSASKNKILDVLGLKEEDVDDGKKFFHEEYRQEYYLLKDGTISLEETSFFEKEENTNRNVETTFSKYDKAELERRAAMISTEFFNSTPHAPKQFKAEIIIGLPGSGKSTSITNKLLSDNEYTVLDSDEIKNFIPEYKENHISSEVSRESGIILDDNILPEYYNGGERHGENIIIQRVGRNYHDLINYLDVLKDSGYTVNLKYCKVSKETSKRRVGTRYIETGRWVPVKNYLNKIDLDDVFEKISNLFDSSEIILNEGD